MRQFVSFSSVTSYSRPESRPASNGSYAMMGAETPPRRAGWCRFPDSVPDGRAPRRGNGCRSYCLIQWRPTLERIVRQRDPTSGLACEKTRKANREPRFIGTLQPPPRSPPLDLAAGVSLAIRRSPKARQDYWCGGVTGRFRPSCLHHCPQLLIRTDLDDHIDIQRRQRSNAALERHRLARLATPSTPRPTSRLKKPPGPSPDSPV